MLNFKQIKFKMSKSLNLGQFMYNFDTLTDIHRQMYLKYTYKNLMLKIDYQYLNIENMNYLNLQADFSI